MPELTFQVESARAAEPEGTPAVVFRIAVENATADEEVHSIGLNVQVQIEPARRRYNDTEKRALVDLFGEPERWARTVRPMFWNTVRTTVPAFAGRAAFDLYVPGCADSAMAAARYVHALNDGDIHVTLLYSGRVLYVTAVGLQMAPISWSQESPFLVAVEACRQVMAAAGTVTAGGAR